ncbi:MAG: hypothetical protein GY838_16660 [bacterium]|nr:hypothetical protein [bacterium]
MVSIRVGIAFFLVVVLSCAPGCGSGTRSGEEAALDRVRSLDKVTIAVTDSGLGGLSVVADAVRKLEAERAYRQVELVFYNALFTAEGGYNSLTGREQKVEIFSRALQGLEDRCAPDIILVACNTLSVLYQDTEFARTTRVPVVGIVEDGVELIADRFEDNESARVIIFATETTVAEDTHRATLVERGIAADRVVTQACPQLASYIEQGFDGMETGFLVDAYVTEALAAAGPEPGPLYVSFNCTHYGYSLAAWQAAFAGHDQAVVEFLDPNLKMIDVLLPPALHGRHEAVDISVRAVSMVEIPAESRDSIGRYLRDISPETAAALADYELQPDLFPWRDVIAD